MGHYHSVSLKTGGNLLKRREAGEVIFVEGLKSVAEGYSGNGGNFDFLAGNSNFLNGLFLFLKETYLSMKSCSNGMIVVDKLTSLFSLGVPFKEVTSFVESLQALAAQTNSTLVTLCKATMDLHRPGEKSIFVKLEAPGYSSFSGSRFPISRLITVRSKTLQPV